MLRSFGRFSLVVPVFSVPVAFRLGARAVPGTGLAAVVNVGAGAACWPGVLSMNGAIAIDGSAQLAERLNLDPQRMRRTTA